MDALSKNLLVFVMNFVKLDIDISVLFDTTREMSPATTAQYWSHEHIYLQELYADANRKNVR